MKMELEEDKICDDDIPEQLCFPFMKDILDSEKASKQKEQRQNYHPTITFDYGRIPSEYDF